MPLIEAIIDGFSAMSGWEASAALLGTLYIIWAGKESLWCWLFAFISSSIYVVILWHDHLPMQAILNFYYVAMAIYGYFSWRGANESQSSSSMAIRSLSWKGQSYFLLLGLLLSVISGYFLTQIASSQYPYLDASITVFSILNTFLVARKILQTWFYWLLIDVAAIILYASTGYFATVIMFFFYLVFAAIAYLNWSKSYRQHPG